MRSYPIAYVYSGNYYWDTGRLYTQTVNSYYWSSSIVSSSHSYTLYMYNAHFIKANNNNKRSGIALRYVMTLRFSSLLVALVQDLILCRMYMLASITGIRVGFTINQ